MIETIITSSVLILAIILLRALFKNGISRRFRYALWALVLLRLLIPVQFFESPISILNTVGSERVQQVENIIQNDLPVFPIGTITANSTTDATANGAAPIEASNPLPEPETAIDWFTLSVTQIVFLIWLCGALAVAVWFMAVNIKFRRILKRSQKLLEVGDFPRPVYLVEMDSSPCLFGLFRPSVYVTPKALESSETLKYVLTHELTHYRHLDHVWAFLRIACLCAYWFNPLVWVAAWLSRVDCEQACDESVVKRIGADSRADYGRAIVSMISSKPSPDMIICTATTMAAGKNSIKKRISAIAANKKTVISALIISVVLVIFAAACTFTGAKGDNGDNVTLYDCDGLSVAIPNEHIDQLIIQTADELDDGMTLITVYEKASADAAAADGLDGDGFGLLFSIVRYEQAQYEQYLCGDSFGLFFFAKDGDKYYGFYQPTDVRYYPSKYSTSDQWVDLNAMSVSIRYDFIERNGLPPYSDDEARLEYTYNSEHQVLNYYPYFSVNGSKETSYTLTLSQPATQGAGGIWCVERMTDSYGNVYLWFPSSGKPASEYYAEVQAEHNAGTRSDHADVFSAARVFLRETGYYDTAVVEGSLELPGDTQFPDSMDDNSPTITVSVTASGETVSPYFHLLYATVWTNDGWLNADGLHMDKELIEALSDQIPTLVMGRDFSISMNVGLLQGIIVYDTDFEPVTNDFYYGFTAVNWLPEGEYYCAFKISGIEGAYIPSEDAYEQSAYQCLFRLVVDGTWNVRPLTPADAHDFTAAELHSYLGEFSITDAEDLELLETYFSSATELVGGAGCPFDSVLYLTRADGAVFAICPAEDSCDAFFSGGYYYSFNGNQGSIRSIFGADIARE